MVSGSLVVKVSGRLVVKVSGSRVVKVSGSLVVKGPWAESFSCFKTVTEPSFGWYWLTPRLACSLVWLSWIIQ